MKNEDKNTTADAGQTSVSTLESQVELVAEQLNSRSFCSSSFSFFKNSRVNKTFVFRKILGFPCRLSLHQPAL